jgi:hypothetical protein
MSWVRELSYMHARNVTTPRLLRARTKRASGTAILWGGDEMPWYSAPQDSLDTLLAGRRVGLMYIVCYLRQRTKVFETYWTTRRGVEAMDNSYRLLDLTIYGRQEKREDSPTGWPQGWGEGKQRMRTDRRPIAQWRRLKAGHSDDLGTGSR